jgi:hypothetical protein
VAFKGSVLSVGELVARAQAAPEPDWKALYGHVGLRNDAADAALECARLLREGESANTGWRFGILQSVDYYDSCVRRGGVELGARVFDREPAPTGSTRLDAAFAALAEHLAVRDGWPVPRWALSAARSTDRWYVAQSPAFYAEADQQSPPAFRSRGVYISANALDRA